MFKNRKEAGIELVKKLQQYKHKDGIVVAIPRGGLPLGRVIADAFSFPLEIALSKKIGHPSDKEYAIGAVSLENYFISDNHGVSQEYIDSEVRRIQKQLAMRHKMFYNGIRPLSLKDKLVIVVDDGIATGNTLISTIDMIKQVEPKKIVVAVPVASESAIRKLEQTNAVDKIICLFVPPVFNFVGEFYERFDQVNNDEAISIFKNKTQKEDENDWGNASRQLPEFQ